ncbi:MAG TPA: hypothetical protein ENK48_06470 [Gammaproteobacteria bacterium]|nr:hypothetical protein [Gammaproteobacteria bacterium]
MGAGKRGLLWLASLWLGACAGPPSNTADLCAIFRERPAWYRDTMEAYRRWGVPVHVQMAIMAQESGFRPLARPGRKKLWGFIPTTWLSSAYGYAQVKDETWDRYRRATGNAGADRDDFGDAVDFIAWYGRRSEIELGISKWDAYRQYLAYHEGQGGYRRATYRDKPWLVRVARRVAHKAKRYRAQLAGCRAELERSPWYWPFNVRQGAKPEQTK